MADTLKDSYTPAGSDDGESLEWRHKSQSFVASSSYAANQIKVRLKKHADAPGRTYYVKLYAADVDGLPTGASLADFGTFNENDLTTDYVTYTYNSDSCDLLSGSRYVITINSVLGSETSSTLYWQTQTGNEYANGVAGHVNGYAGWFADSDNDRWFEVWGAGAPTKAANPSPADAAADVTLDHATISWEDGGGADTFDVYYGQDAGSLVKVSDAQVGTSFTISDIDYGSPFDYETNRAWRIDATNAYGTTTGDVWTFTTIMFAPPPPGIRGFDSEEGDFGGGAISDGDMNIKTRLVAFTNNKVYYEDT